MGCHRIVHWVAVTKPMAGECQIVAAALWNHAVDYFLQHLVHFVLDLVE